jgi:hypothetical protein
MSGLDGEQFRWRDTYFVWFSSKNRPTLKQVEQALKALPEHFELQLPEVDDDGGFESLTLFSAGDHAALEIAYLEGADLREQAMTLAEEIKEGCEGVGDRLTRLARCDARFDVMQFEQVEEDEDDDMFDPSTLLIVLGALAKLVDGIGVDPQSGLLV